MADIPAILTYNWVKKTKKQQIEGLLASLQHEKHCSYGLCDCVCNSVCLFVVMCMTLHTFRPLQLHAYQLCNSLSMYYTKARSSHGTEIVTL